MPFRVRDCGLIWRLGRHRQRAICWTHSQLIQKPNQRMLLDAVSCLRESASTCPAINHGQGSDKRVGRIQSFLDRQVQVSAHRIAKFLRLMKFQLFCARHRKRDRWVTYRPAAPISREGSGRCALRSCELMVIPTGNKDLFAIQRHPELLCFVMRPAIARYVKINSVPQLGNDERPHTTFEL